MNFVNLPFEISSLDKNYYIELSNQHTADYYQHFSSGNNDYTNLEILFLNKDQHVDSISDLVQKIGLEPSAISIMRCKENKVISAHTDSEKFNRNTVIAFPLTPEKNHYAPVYFPDDDQYIPYSHSYMFTTQQTHQLSNNNNLRLNLQIWYTESIHAMQKLLIDKQLFML